MFGLFCFIMFEIGGMPEWPKGTAWKAVVDIVGPWVRIPLPPHGRVA